MKILFYQRGTPCSGASLEHKPLGGTESAMIYMAQALAARGHTVVICNDADLPGTHVGVAYHHWRDFESVVARFQPDVLMCIRMLLPVLAKRWAPVQIYFSPDAYDQPFLNSAMQLRFQNDQIDYDIGLYNLRFVAPYVDAVFCVGAWQAQTFHERFAVPLEKLHVVANGVHLAHFASARPLAARRRQLAYCSTPFRGLKYLLQYFPAIRRRVPDATCAVMSGMQLYGQTDAQDQQAYGALYDLAKQPGVTLHGPLPKSQLADVLQESRVFAYPNTFAETFCIAALEAQAAGLPGVSTQLAGLCERITDGTHGFLIPGHPSEPSYAERFIECCVKLLADDTLWQRMHEAAQSQAAPFAYETLAEKWESLLQQLFEQQRPHDVPTPLFMPTATTVHAVVNGYPRQIDLTARILRRYYAATLREAGLARCAEHIEAAGEGA